MIVDGTLSVERRTGAVEFSSFGWDVVPAEKAERRSEEFAGIAKPPLWA